MRQLFGFAKALFTDAGKENISLNNVEEEMAASSGKQTQFLEYDELCKSFQKHAISWMSCTSSGKYGAKRPEQHSANPDDERVENMLGQGSRCKGCFELPINPSHCQPRPSMG